MNRSGPPGSVPFDVEEPALSPQVAARHLKVLRDLIHHDYLATTDFDHALRDLARMAQRALSASQTMVALFDPADESWSAVTSRGERLSQDAIAKYGSRSVLDEVRKTGEPILTTSDLPLNLSSASIMENQLESVLAVPLFWWDVSAQKPEKHFAGCIYAHRTADDDPFSYRDVVLVLDITAIAQPNLNLLRRLQDLESSLEASREQLNALRQAVSREYRLGQYETRDPWFAERVIIPLQSISHADRVSMLILGPTGSGKSYLAQAYHYACPRKSGPFVVLDCSQVTSAETLAAELFGYAPRSGYANAPQNGRPGKAQLADKGTLFIDEIGCLPADLQQKLLRLIQTGHYSPLGSPEEKQVDIQVIAATNEDLRQRVAERQFREDLYWRLSEVTLHLPPLSNRAADIPIFARKFLEQACQRYARTDVRGLSDRAVAALTSHDWARAGNLRGLEHTLNRSVLLAPPGTSQLEAAHLQFEALFDYRAGHPVGAGRAAAERAGALNGEGEPRGRGQRDLETVKAAILEHGSATAAAKALGMTRDAVIWRLRKAGLTVGDLLPGGS